MAHGPGDTFVHVGWAVDYPDTVLVTVVKPALNTAFQFLVPGTVENEWDISMTQAVPSRLPESVKRWNAALTMEGYVVLDGYVEESAPFASGSAATSPRSPSGSMSLSSPRSELEVPQGMADYILRSDSGYLTQSEVESMPNDQLRLARNEIFARHGRAFNNPELKSYFHSKSWYRETMSAEEFDSYPAETMLNEYELENLRLIQAEEKRRGL